MHLSTRGVPTSRASLPAPFDRPPLADETSVPRRRLERGAYASFSAPWADEFAPRDFHDNGPGILLATTLPAFADGLRSWFDDPAAGVSVVGICVTATELARSVERERPVVLVATDELASAELVGALMNGAPQLRVMVLISDGGARREARFVKTGVGAVVPITADRERVVGAVHSLLDGQAVVSTAALQLVAGTGRREAPALTHRQREVLELLARGSSTAQIAEQLVVTPSTVKTHMRQIGERFGVSGHLALAVNARQLLDGEPVSQPM